MPREQTVFTGRGPNDGTKVVTSPAPCPWCNAPGEAVRTRLVQGTPEKLNYDHDIFEIHCESCGGTGKVQLRRKGETPWGIQITESV